jgi:hypothetical protein
MNTSTESTGRIRIIKVPDGEAPYEIRQAWLGLTLPCDPFLGLPGSGLDLGVLSLMPVEENRLGFSVPQEEALAILEKENPGAADWWKQQGYPQAEQRFGFAEEEAEIVKWVTRQRIIEITEEMMGNPDR